MYLQISTCVPLKKEKASQIHISFPSV